MKPGSNQQTKFFYIIFGAVVVFVATTVLLAVLYAISSSGDNSNSKSTTCPSTSLNPNTEGSITSSDFDFGTSTTKLATTSEYTQTSSSGETNVTSTSSEITTSSDEGELTSSTSQTSPITEIVSTSTDSITSTTTDENTISTTTEPDYPDIPDDSKDNEYLLKNSTKLNSWINNENLKHRTDFYFFNVTNPYDEQKKTKFVPELQEVGPFKFLEKRVYDVQGWSADGQHLQFTYRKIYTPFDDETRIKLKQNVTVLNVPLVTLYNLIDNFERNNLISKLLLIPLKLHLSTYPLFVTQKVEDLLFSGYEDNLVDKIKIFLKTMELLNLDLEIPSSISKNGRFSFMNSRNNSDFGLWTVHTGKGNKSRLGQLYSIDGERNVGCWSKQCSEIKGSDGIIFASKSADSDNINIFTHELNRSIQLDYELESKVDDIKTAKFFWSNDTLKSKKELEANNCFYPPKKSAMDDLFDIYSGILRNSHCNHNIPLMFSYPHLYEADKILRSLVKGLSPNATHRSYIELRKDNSEFISSMKNVQINIDTKVVSAYRRFNRFIFPVFWLSETSRMT